MGPLTQPKHPGGRPAIVQDGKPIMVWLGAEELAILDTVRAPLGWSRSRAIREAVLRANRNITRYIEGKLA